MLKPTPGELLNIEERVRIAWKLGESHFREFKSAFEGDPTERKPRDAKAIARDIGETLVAFANADGGELIVGIEDDNTITGVPHSDERVKVMLKVPQTYVLPETPLQSVRAYKVVLTGSYAGKGCLLYFSVAKGTQYIHQTIDGRCLQRHDMESRPISAQRIQYELQERRSREYDRQFMDGATRLDLDEDLIKKVAAKTVPGTSAEKTLQLLDLAEYQPGGLQLRRAALLLFAKDINRFHPRCQVRILYVSGTNLGVGKDYNVKKEELLSDNILNLLSLMWDHLRPNLAVKRLGPSALFEEILLYPEAACVEALINAVAHRDYSLEGQGVEIYLFDDRLTVRSPGELLSTVKIEQLKQLTKAHQSRNPYITRVLRELGYMRELGEGIPRIFQSMEERDLVPPEIKSENGVFTITLFSRSVFSEEDLRWLESYEFCNPTKDEQRILLLGKDGHLISPQEIREALKIVDTEDYRKIVESMLRKGLIYSVRTLTDPKIAKRWSSERRRIGRFGLRPLGELERFFSELTSALSRLSPTEHLSAGESGQIRRHLCPGNPYGDSEVELRQSLRYLGFVDQDWHPTARLWSLWRPRR